MYISRTRCCYRDCLHIMQGLLQLVPKKSPTLLCKCANVANSVVEMDYLTLHCVVTFVILILCMMFYLGCFPYRIVAPLLVIRCYIVQHGYCAPPTPHEQFLQSTVGLSFCIFCFISDYCAVSFVFCWFGCQSPGKTCHGNDPLL